MYCPNCNSYNDDLNAFCINCGETFAAAGPGPTMISPGGSRPVASDADSPSEETVIHVPAPVFPPANPPFQQSQQIQQPQFAAFQQSFPMIPPAAQAERRSNTGLLVGIAAVLLVLVVAAGGIVAYLLIPSPSKKTETLPASFGLYFQNSDKTEITEIRKREFDDVAEARDEFRDDRSLPLLDPKPNLVLYGDAKDVPVGELRIVEIGSIEDDGDMKHIEFRSASVEGKPDMKRIWVDDDLANGKYAFAIFDGDFEDGKHRFWPFEIRGGNRKDNGDLAKSMKIERKSKDKSTPKAEKTPEKKVEPPPNASVAYCQLSNVVLRSGPTQMSGKIGSIRMGQKLYVIEYSDRYETFITRDGRELNSNYAHVQTESGRRGWVYAAFIK